MSCLQFERMTIFLTLTTIILKLIVEHRSKLCLSHFRGFKWKYLVRSVIRCCMAKCALRFNKCPVVSCKSKDRLLLCYQHQKCELRRSDVFYVMIAIYSLVVFDFRQSLNFLCGSFSAFLATCWNWGEGDTSWRLHKVSMMFVADNSWEGRCVLEV